MAELKTKEAWLELLDGVDNCLFDCDGVLWSGATSVIKGAQDTIKFLRTKGKKVYFVTNNGSKSRAQYLQKLINLHFEAYEEEIFCTSYVTAYYLRHMLNFSGKVYLAGMEGFAQDLALQGIDSIGPGEDHIQGEPSDWVHTKLDPEVKAVVVTYDKHFSFAKMLKACSYAKNPDNIFIGSNEDPYLPTPNKEVLIPGTGCIVASVKYGAEREPLIMGKPYPPVFEVIQHRTNLDPARTLMIGDRLITDILFGLNFGMKTLLVLTGADTIKDLEDTPSDKKPHYYSQSVAGFLTCISE